MAEPITLQKLIDASMDSDALETLVNGDDNTQVTTRTGETYPSAKKAIKTIFENGGIPAVPFRSKADMVSSSLLDGDYAIVTDDTIQDNVGLYQKIAGAWVYTKYNNLAQIKEVTAAFNTIDNRIFQTSDTDVIQMSDNAGKVVLAVKNNGGLEVVGLNGSVQDEINELRDIETSSFNLLEFVDENEVVFASFDAAGGLRITNTNGTVQANLNKYATKPFSPSNRGLQYELSTQANNYLAPVSLKSPNRCPPIIHTLPQNYSIGTAWINEITLTQPDTHIVVDSPYKGVDTVVHPSIAEFWGGLNGYRYYVALNPYGSGGEPLENPCIYASNDLEQFDLLDFIPQPLDKPSQIVQYLSDNHLSYDPNTGEMLLVWRDTLPTGDGLWISRTTDGVNFTDKQPLYPVSPRSVHGGLLSPSLLFNITDNLWYMYTTRTDGSFEYRTASKLTGSASDWSASNIIFAGDATWHCDVRLIGDKIVCLINHRNQKRLQLAISSDWKNFTLSTTSNFLTGDDPYKASFVPVFNNSGQMALKVVWTSSQITPDSKSWLLYSATTNYVNI